MQFVYSENAGLQSLEIENELYKYLFKVRRHNLNDTLAFRNLKDNTLFMYKVALISKKSATLNLDSSEERIICANKSLHLGWCVVDTKTIEKQLPYLNELGVESIDFIYADYSQKNFKLNIEKYTKILINSSQQCGRSTLMKLNSYDSLDNYLQSHPDAYVFNFSSLSVDAVSQDINAIVVGCEGGFSPREIALFEKDKIVGINSDLILRSETAVTTLAAKIIV